MVSESSVAKVWRLIAMKYLFAFVLQSTDGNVHEKKALVDLCRFISRVD